MINKLLDEFKIGCYNSLLKIHHQQIGYLCTFTSFLLVPSALTTSFHSLDTDLSSNIRITKEELFLPYFSSLSLSYFNPLVPNVCFDYCTSCSYVLYFLLCQFSLLLLITTFRTFVHLSNYTIITSFN